MGTHAGVLTQTLAARDDASLHEGHIHPGRITTAPCPQHALPALNTAPPPRIPNPQLRTAAAVHFDSDAAQIQASDDDGNSNGNGGDDGGDDDDGSDPDRHGDTEAQQPHPLPPEAAAISAAGVPNSVWDSYITVPGSRSNRRIFPKAPFQWGQWTTEQWQDRFMFVKKELDDLVYNHLRLVNTGSCPTFSPRMVGTCPSGSDARPSVVVVCREVDFRKIRNLLHKRAEDRLYLFEKQPTIPRLRFTFAPRVGRAESTIPHLRLVYYRTGMHIQPVNRNALDKPLLAYLRDGGVSCGSIIQHGERSATLGVALENEQFRGILTVDHLVFPSATLAPSPPALDCDSPLCSRPNSPLSREHDGTDSDTLWMDDDEYDDLDTDDSDPSNQGQLDPQAAPLKGSCSKETELFWATKVDGTRCADGDPEEWNVLSSSAQLAPSDAYLDWALVWPQSTAQDSFLSRLNKVFPGGHGSEAVVLEGFHNSPTAHLAPVYIVSGIRGTLQGQILALPSFLSSFATKESVEAWTVVLDASHGPVMHGESGSVVIDKATNKVYGHIVGSDPHGHAYVVPLANVFAQVMRAFIKQAAGLTFAVPRSVSETLAQRPHSTVTLETSAHKPGSDQKHDNDFSMSSAGNAGIISEPELSRHETPDASVPLEDLQLTDIVGAPGPTVETASMPIESSHIDFEASPPSDSSRGLGSGSRKSVPLPAYSGKTSFEGKSSRTKVTPKSHTKVKKERPPRTRFRGDGTDNDSGRRSPLTPFSRDSSYDKRTSSVMGTADSHLHSAYGLYNIDASEATEKPSSSAKPAIWPFDEVEDQSSSRYGTTGYSPGYEPYIDSSRFVAPGSTGEPSSTTKADTDQHADDGADNLRSQSMAKSLTMPIPATYSYSVPMNSEPYDYGTVAYSGMGGISGASLSPQGAIVGALATAYLGYSCFGSEADSNRDTPRPEPGAAEMYLSHGDSRASEAQKRSELDEHTDYAVHPSSRFRRGKILKIIWSEPLGSGGPKSEVPTGDQPSGDSGQPFYQGLRRFIVVANEDGNCTCVPILTYERQGYNKKGARALRQGIIYQAGKRPRMLPDEPQLGFSPVRAIMRDTKEQLAKDSRVDYAKLQTIEHDFRVCFIGYVDPDDFKNIVIPAVDHCWESKRRHND